MKKILQVFFITLGIIFFLLLMVGLYVYIADPFNLRALWNSDTVTSQEPTDVSETDRNPALNASQEQALETVGIDPARIPSEITPEQEACFVDVLGQFRVDEIKAGDAPGPLEIIRARSCVE